MDSKQYAYQDSSKNYGLERLSIEIHRSLQEEE